MIFKHNKSMNFKELSKIMAQRRSVYPNMYNDTPISDEEILQLLQNANWAPNHKKTEPWRWHIIRDEGLQRLSEHLGQWYIDNTAENKYSPAKYKKTKLKPLQSQAVIAICMYNNPEINIPKWEETAAVSMAVQNLWLSCTALGIGSYWSSPRAASEASSFLDLDKNEECLGWFYMGNYDRSNKVEGQRGDYRSKITWIKE